MPNIVNIIIRKPLSIVGTLVQKSAACCCSVFQLASSSAHHGNAVTLDQEKNVFAAPETPTFRPEAIKDQSDFVVTLVEAEDMEAAGCPPVANSRRASALTSKRTLTLHEKGKVLVTTVASVTIFQKYSVIEPNFRTFDRYYTWFFVFFVLGAGLTILCLQLKQHNRTASSLRQQVSSSLLDSPWTCDCTLPSNLLGFQKGALQVSSSSDGSLKKCYRKEDLSTITVVQFNNDTASDVAQTLQDLNAAVNLSHATNQNGWFFLEQDPTELVLWSGQDDRTLASICNGVPYLDTVFTFALDDPNLSVYFDYPLQYTRMAIEYNCSDCSLCSPEHIMNQLRKINSSFLLLIDQWIECSGHEVDRSAKNPCISKDRLAVQSYHGRCNLYPTFDISMSTRLRQALDTLKGMNPTLNITTRASNGKPGIEMHANVLYFNRSSVVRMQNFTYAYFQVDKSTNPIWPILISKYPNLAGSCSTSYMAASNVSVCNGTSICNVYKELGQNGVSTPTLNCIDFHTNYNVCLHMANVTGNEGIKDKLCQPNSPSCEYALPYQVKYPVLDLGITPPDTKSVSSIMMNFWQRTYTSSVCSIEYANVVKFTLSSSNRSVFLQTVCNSQDLCTITGNYTVVNDTPDTSPRPVEPGPDRTSLEPFLTPHYVCYRLTTIPWITFFVTLLGTIGGWLSALYTGANILYSPLHDRWEAWCNPTQGGSTKVHDSINADDEGSSKYPDGEESMNNNGAGTHQESDDGAATHTSSPQGPKNKPV